MMLKDLEWEPVDEDGDRLVRLPDPKGGKIFIWLWGDDNTYSVNFQVDEDGNLGGESVHWLDAVELQCVLLNYLQGNTP